MQSALLVTTKIKARQRHVPPRGPGSWLSRCIWGTLLRFTDRSKGLRKFPRLSHRDIQLTARASYHGWDQSCQDLTTPLRPRAADVGRDCLHPGHNYAPSKASELLATASSHAWAGHGDTS